MNGWEARITVAKRQRRCFALTTCATEEEAEERTALLASLAYRLRRAGTDQETVERLVDMAAAREGAPLASVREAVEALCGSTVEDIPLGDARSACPTFKEFAQDWTSGKLAKRWPDQVAAKRSATDDEGRLSKHVYPHIGHVRLDDLTLDHAERVMAELPVSLSRASRRHVAQAMVRVVRLAVYPARHIKVSPLPRGFLPKLRKGKAKGYVYPDEDRKLLATVAVPLPFRVLWGFLHREGMRTGEAVNLKWGDVDLERGAIRLDLNKTDQPRAWALDPGSFAALVAWRELATKVEDHDPVFVGEDGSPLSSKLADEYRKHLQVAEIKRSELFASTAIRQRIRAHDTRATFITLALANGRSEAWVQDRTGHRSSQMINRYRRAARTAQELELGWFAPLHEAIPELRGLFSGPRKGHGPPSGGIQEQTNSL
ncbi:MAG: site-specific integrase, partial [Myxococcales bacterium]|nr:site-specific integrase [Myxococcales bacterium]